MAHRGYGGKKAKPQKKAKHARHFETCEDNMRRRLEKWKRNRKCWANDPDYQDRQKLRKEKLERSRQRKEKKT